MTMLRQLCQLQRQLPKQLQQQLLNNYHHHQFRQTKLQQCHRRFVHGQGGNKYGTEEMHISKTVQWLREKCPRLIVHVDKITTVGCDFLPYMARKTIYEAKFRILVLTHGDILSKRALQHQIALAEDMSMKYSRGQFFPAAIFVVDLLRVEKQKQLKHLIDAMHGALHLNNLQQRAFVVTGIPNVGKSSLILPLTKGRTLAVKKKKAYHLPKVGPVAGLTLGIKSHVMETPDHDIDISLFDSPGLRRRALECDTPTLMELVATNSTTYRKTYSTLFNQDDCVNVVLRALNRHADIAGETPMYVSMLGLKGRTDDVKVFLDAVDAREGHKTPRANLIRACNQGDYGGLVFSGHGSLNIDKVDPGQFIRDQPIVYRNEFAKILAEYGKNPALMITDPRLEGYREQMQKPLGGYTSESSAPMDKSPEQLGRERRQNLIQEVEDVWDF